MESKTSMINFYITQNRIIEDLFAMDRIQPLLKNNYLPFTNATIRPINLACILNDIVLNNRNSILEFGAGVSTVIIGRLIKMNQLNTKIISVDDDIKWICNIQELIDKEKLGDIITLIYAPLKDYELTPNNNQWYDVKILDSISHLKFDMTIIDGPQAWEPQKKESRFPAFPYIKDKLLESSAVFLDDADREGEKNIMLKWEKKYNIKFQIIRNTLGYYSQGKCFNSKL